MRLDQVLLYDFFEDLCAHHCFGKSGIKLTTHWKGIACHKSKETQSDSSQAQVQGLPLNLLWLARILADAGHQCQTAEGLKQQKQDPAR